MNRRKASAAPTRADGIKGRLVHFANFNGTQIIIFIFIAILISTCVARQSTEEKILRPRMCGLVQVAKSNKSGRAGMNLEALIPHLEAFHRLATIPE